MNEHKENFRAYINDVEEDMREHLPFASWLIYQKMNELTELIEPTEDGESAEYEEPVYENAQMD